MPGDMSAPAPNSWKTATTSSCRIGAEVFTALKPRSAYFLTFAPIASRPVEDSLAMLSWNTASGA